MSTKNCIKCQVNKELSEFYTDQRNGDGHQSQCKICQNKQRKEAWSQRTDEQIAKERERIREYAHSPNGIINTGISSAKYRNTIKCKKGKHQYYLCHKEILREQQKNYHKTEKCRLIMRKSAEKYRQKERQTELGKLKQRANNAVQRAIRTGKLPNISSQACQQCGKTADDYHHPSGYDKENQLNVIPLCRPCHNSLSHFSKEFFD